VHHTEVVHLTEVKFTLEEATEVQRGVKGVTLLFL
jgi:hypothetical protein